MYSWQYLLLQDILSALNTSIDPEPSKVFRIGFPFPVW
jgi:hypothetical protein